MPSQSPEQHDAEEWVRSHDLPVWFVYGLVNEDGEVVYVGNTKDVYKRLRQHKEKDLRGGAFGGEVARAAILNAGLTEAEAWMWESRRYDEFHPKYNKNRPPGGRPSQRRES
jgi:predicted GIY-YIG superfamily endonuclease